MRMAAGTAVIAGTAGAVRHHQDQKYAQQDQQAYAEQAAQQQANAQPAAAPAAPEDPTMAQLQQLAALHSSGVLTDEEFAASKAKLLGI